MTKSPEEKAAEKEYQEQVVDPHPQWFSDPDALTSDENHPVHREQEQKAKSTSTKESK